jgi:hypothetical protein
VQDVVTPTPTPLTRPLYCPSPQPEGVEAGISWKWPCSSWYGQGISPGTPVRLRPQPGASDALPLAFQVAEEAVGKTRT